MQPSAASTAADLLAMIREAVHPESDATAVTTTTEFYPAAGRYEPIKPTSFARDEHSDGWDTWGKYHVMSRRHPDTGDVVDAVLLDSRSSQMNRWEDAVVRQAEELGLPMLVSRFEHEDLRKDVTSYSAPHGPADAYWREALYTDGDNADQPFLSCGPGRRMRLSTTVDAAGMFEVYPHALVKGWMFAFPQTGSNTKSSDAATKSNSAPNRDAVQAQVLISEIVGYEPTVPTVTEGVKGDPLNIAGFFVGVDEDGEKSIVEKPGKDTKKMSDHGNGPVPYGSEKGKAAFDAVSLTLIRRVSVLSFGLIKKFRFPDRDGDHSTERDIAGRTVVALLAMLGDLGARRTTTLRSGCVINPVSTRQVWVAMEQPDTEFGPIQRDVLIDAFHMACRDAADHGLVFGDDTALTPTEFIHNGFVHTIEAVADVPEQS